MAKQGKHGIAWTEQTWNPIRGCSRVSPGCTRCYAERTAMRFSGPGMPYEGLVKISNGHPQWTGEIAVVPDKMWEPLRWTKPRMVFVNSMSDLFHENLSEDVIDDMFAVMALCPQHVFQCLTKRAERQYEYMSAPGRGGTIISRMARIAFDEMTKADRSGRMPSPASYAKDIDWDADVDASVVQIKDFVWPPKNVWLGVSVEDQPRADERIPWLLKTPAAVRWLSIEPQLGPIDLRLVRMTEDNAGGSHYRGSVLHGRGHIDWVVVGGESGPGARPFNTEWAESLLGQCKSAGVAYFMKQLGANVIQGGEVRKKKDPKGGDMHEWPHCLRVREFPAIAGGV